MSTSARLLRDSCRMLEGITDQLDSAVQDVPRLRKVLEIQKVHGFIPLSDLRAAQKEREAVEKDASRDIKKLMDTIEGKLAALRRRKATLQRQSDRLSATFSAAAGSSPKSQWS